MRSRCDMLLIIWPSVNQDTYQRLQNNAPCLALKTYYRPLPFKSARNLIEFHPFASFASSFEGWLTGLTEICWNCLHASSINLKYICLAWDEICFISTIHWFVDSKGPFFHRRGRPKRPGLSKILEVNPWCFVDVDLQEPHLEGSPALQPELKLRVWELKMQMGRWARVNPWLSPVSPSHKEAWVLRITCQCDKNECRHHLLWRCEAVSFYCVLTKLKMLDACLLPLTSLF